MNFRFTEEEEAFRKEVAEFLDKEFTPEARAEKISTGDMAPGPAGKVFLHKLGQKGWIGPGWPKQYGGLEYRHMKRFIIVEEMAYRGWWHPTSAQIMGPVILRYGTEEQKNFFIYKLASGELNIAAGFSEPDAGSDLSNLQLRAVEDGDYFVLNGQKVWNSGFHFSAYTLLAVRTDPDVIPKYKGISLLLVDNTTPGITSRPTYTMGERTNEVFFDNVRVPKSCLLGKKNEGWVQLTTALAFERAWTIGDVRRDFDELVDYCRKTERNGKPLSKDPLVRQKLAQLAIELEVAWLFACRVACMIDKGLVPDHSASILKVFGSELEQHVAKSGIEILGLYGPLTKESPWAQLNGRMGYIYPDHVRYPISRGTNEIQRTIIAQRGLGMPRG
jgi:alkylation response protein AidB-like acyl-CoA dehydrogenase